jgi:hypothetical protein
MNLCLGSQVWDRPCSYQPLDKALQPAKIWQLGQ